MTSLTDPFGAQVQYQHDAVGRVTSITGSGFANVSNYASGIQYRAWGALKHQTYGNNRTANVAYNSRLQVSRYEVPGIMGLEYEYTSPSAGDNDGQVKFARDLTETNSKFDRGYRYDHLGRLSEASTGSEARGGNTPDGPYHQTYSFDAFDNITGRTNRVWGDDFGEMLTIDPVTNRNQSWSYDADGRMTHKAEPLRNFTFDAAGRWVTKTDQVERLHVGLINRTQHRAYDGDGRWVKQTKITQVTYEIRSSVLGGRLITEMNSSGQKQTANVYAGTEILARQRSTPFGDEVVWRHLDPLRVGEWNTAADGTQRQLVQLDPVGADVGTAPPEAGPIPEPYFPEHGDPTQFADGILLDGAEVPWGALHIILAFMVHSPQPAAASPGSYLDSGTFVEAYDSESTLVSNGGGDGAWFVNVRPTNPPQLIFVPGRGLVTSLITPTVPQKTGGQRCDDRLAGIFGAEGSVFATDRDPSTLANPGARDRNRLLSPSESPVNGHAHIYASPTGAGVEGGNLFTPTGYRTEERASYMAHQDTIPELQNYHRFTYLPGSLRGFGYSGGLVISFIHSGPTNGAGRPFAGSASDRPGFLLVGTIGNFGGVDVGGSDPGYVHSHIRFYSADRRGRRGAPIDPRRVFCRDLGF